MPKIKLKKHKKNNRDLKYYLSLPWKFEFTQHPDGGYSSHVVGLSCYSGGKTLTEASKEIENALEFYIESCLADGFPIPEPSADTDKANGRLNFRTSKSTHLRLLQKAKEENVSVSYLINDAIIKRYG